jgi:hypothetical protein
MNYQIAYAYLLIFRFCSLLHIHKLFILKEVGVTVSPTKLSFHSARSDECRVVTKIRNTKLSLCLRLHENCAGIEANSHTFLTSSPDAGEWAPQPVWTQQCQSPSRSSRKSELGLYCGRSAFLSDLPSGTANSC